MKHRLLFTLLAVLLAAQAWATEVPGYGDIVLQYAWISTSGSSVNIDNEDQRWAQCDYYVWYNSAKSIAIIRYVNYQHWSSNATYTVPNSLSIGGKSHKVVGLWKLDNRQMILDNGKITTLNLPEGLEFIKGNEAINLANITSLTLPASLTWLSSSACKAPRVTTLTLKDSATPLTIDGWEGYTNGVFGYMPVATATVGRSLVSENRPFGCSDENMTLKTLTITGSMKTMMNDFCNGQRKLATVTIKEGVTNISNSAFRDCGKLTAITIPNSVKVIEEHAFRGDTLLNKVNLGAGVKYIRDYAFLDCRSVTALTLPASLDSIDDGAFYNMSGVKTLTIEDNSKELLIRGWTGYTIGAFGWFADGYTATVGRNFNLKAYGEAEANRPFGYSKVGKVTMTDYVTRLNSSEYYYCSLLKNVTLSPNIKEIPDNTFQNDTLLTGIAIPDKVTHIGLRAFQNDSMMTTLTMSKGVKYIRDYAFDNCFRVPSLVLPASLDSIDDGAFYNMRGVRTLTIEDNSKELLIRGWTGYTIGAFGWFADGYTATVGRNFNLKAYGEAEANRPFGYSKVSRVTMTNYVTRLNSSEYYNCSLLKNVALSTNIKEIPDNTFQNDTLLTGIVIPDKVTHIGLRAFQNDSMMTSVTMSKGVKYIRDYAFDNCKRVPSLVLPASLDSIDDGAFCNMRSVRTLTIEDNSKPLLIRGWTGYTIGAFGWFGTSYNAYMGRNFRLKAYGEAEANRPFGHSELGQLTLGPNVGQLNSDEFYNCQRLTKITSKATTVPTCPNTNVFYKVNRDIPVYVPKGTVSKYKAAIGWKEFYRIYEEAGTRGDISGDGAVDVDDMNIVINIMVHKATQEQWPNADVNGDGTVDVDDLNIIINIMIHKE